MNLSNQRSVFKKPLCCGLAGAFTLVFALQPAQAYNAKTHSRLTELAVRSMSEVDHGSLEVPSDDPELFTEYLAAIQAAPAKLVLLKTGLPRRQGDGSVLERDSNFPFGENYSACPLYDDAQETLDLNKVEEFRIADLRYLPQRDTVDCRIIPALKDQAGVDNLKFNDDGTPTDPAAVQRRVLELTLGTHATAPDYHLHDSKVWFRPTSMGITSWGLALEGASRVWEAGIGALLLPFACVWNAVFEDGCDFDDSYDFARKYNPVEFVEGWIPGVRESSSEDYSTLWHFLHLDDEFPHYNDVRGMRHEYAGPNMMPGAVDVVIMAVTFASGLSLKAKDSQGIRQYGQYDRVQRKWWQWQAHPIGLTEFSPIHHLARFGWERFLAEGAVNAGHLAWPLHALGDAAAPHHVVATTGWGHRPFEDHIDHDQELYLLAEDQTARDAQLERIVQRGYSWWRYVREEGVPNLVLQLADHTRWTLRQEGDWPFFDTASTVYHGHDPFRDGGPNAGEKLYKGAVMSASNVLAAQDLLEESAGAMLAFLAFAASHIENGAPRGDIDCPPGQRFSLNPEPGCTDNPGASPPVADIGDDIDSISGPIRIPPTSSCQEPCTTSDDCSSNQTCRDGCCGTIR